MEAFDSGRCERQAATIWRELEDKGVHVVDAIHLFHLSRSRQVTPSRATGEKG